MASYRFLFLIVLVLVGSASVWSQERILSEEEFDRIHAGARRLSYVAPYRVRMWSQHFKKGVSTPTMSISEIFESQANDRTRNLRMTTEGEVAKKVETVKIDKVSFERIDDGPWKRKADSDSSRFGGQFSELPLKKKEFTFRYVGKDLVNSIDADLYESRQFREYEADSYHHAYTVVNRFWVQANGKLLKDETETFEADGSVSFRMGQFYEYPTNLVIVAPIK